MRYPIAPRTRNCHKFSGRRQNFEGGEPAIGKTLDGVFLTGWEEFDGFLGAIGGCPRIWVYSARRRMLSEWLLNSGAYMHSIEAYPMGYSPANCTLTGYSKT